VGPRLQDKPDPLGEFVERDATFARRNAKVVHDGLAIEVRGALGGRAFREDGGLGSRGRQVSHQ